jgi:hypothetical protein
MFLVICKKKNNIIFAYSFTFSLNGYGLRTLNVQFVYSGDK